MEDKILKEQKPIPEESEEHEEDLKKVASKQVIVHKENERDIDEDDILDDKEVVLNQRLKSQSKP